MKAVVLAFACLACACQGRKLQSTSDHNTVGSGETRQGNSLAKLLLALSPTAAFNNPTIGNLRHATLSRQHTSSAPHAHKVLPRLTPAPVMDGIMERIVQGASQGAVAAVVAATLSAFTEPVVNRILVNRMGVFESISKQNISQSLKFLQTTLPTNFLKFPLFEAVNAAMQVVPMSPTMRGFITGLAFTTVTLPVTNYRFCKSMGYPINLEALWKAYLPTVVRDIIYGITRNQVQGAMIAGNPGVMSDMYGRAWVLSQVVLWSCLASAPGNELRGYYLQPKEKRMGFATFFKPVNFIRSTTIGALIMAISLGVGSIFSSYIEMFMASLRSAPVA